jgi:hypothetical protein
VDTVELAAGHFVDPLDVFRSDNGIFRDITKMGDLVLNFFVEQTVGAAAFFSGEVLPDGPVRFTVNQGFYVGERPEGTSERVQQLVGALGSKATFIASGT